MEIERHEDSQTAFDLVLSWLTCSKLSLSEKCAYLVRLVGYTLSRHRNQILYLGTPFSCDNPKMPYVLLRYPEVVGVSLLGNLRSSIHTVLDIGGNVGQFAATLLHYLPNLDHLDVFEPNPTVLPFLERNLSDKRGVTIYPMGVGATGQRSLYFVPGASATGSFISNRASHSGTSTSKRTETELQVNIHSDVAGLTGRSDYDLVKIDVEGAEFEVLSELSVTTRYFWLELSGSQYAGQNHTTSEIFDVIRNRFGEFNILFQSQWNAATACDILLEIVKPMAR